MKRRALGGGVLVAVVAAGIYLGSANRTAIAEETDEDALAVVVEGCRNAVSSVQSGKGQVTQRFWSRLNDGGTKEIETTYQTAFSGNRFKISAYAKYLQYAPATPPADEALLPEPGTVIRRETSCYDGERVLRYLPDEGSATIADSGSKTLAAKIPFQDFKFGGAFAGVGHGLIEMDEWTRRLYSPLVSAVSRSGPRIVGRETLNGDECIIVESVLERTYGTHTTQAWVNPAKGFTAPRTRSWLQLENDAEKRLSFEADVEVREYGGGLWGPARVVQKQYRINHETGEYYKDLEITTTYADDFQINVPVSEEELTITLPSGTEVKDELLEETHTVP